MAKKLLNIILILILFITVLPIKQVGKALFNNQWTEELNDHHETEKKAELTKWTFLTGHSTTINEESSVQVNNSSYFVFCQSLPSIPAGEIHYPPPDLLQEYRLFAIAS